MAVSYLQAAAIEQYSQMLNHNSGPEKYRIYNIYTMVLEGNIILDY